MVDRAHSAAANDGANERQARDSLFLAARLKLPESEPMQVRVRNLSPGGLMAELPFPASVGERLTIEVRGIGWVPGRIAWSVEDRVGIAFDQPIDPLAARKPVGGGTGTPHFVKPIITRR